MPLHPLSKNKTEVIFIEIKKLLEKKVINFSRPEVNELISGVFTRGKKDGNKRMVLNFKRFKKFVNYEHFKINRLTMSYISYNLMHIWYQLVWKMHFSQHKFMRVNSILIIYFSSFVQQMDTDLHGGCVLKCLKMSKSFSHFEAFESKRCSLCR